MKRTKLIALLLLMLLLSACTQTEEKTEAATETTETETEAVTEAETQETVMAEKETIDLDALLEDGKPILLQFSQDGCPPCEQMLPSILRAQEDYADTAHVKYVDVHQNMDLAVSYRVRMTPTQVFIDADGNYYEPENLTGIEYVDLEDGTRVVRHVGMIPEELMRSYLDDMIAGTAEE